MWKREVLSCRKGVEQVRDFIWVGVSLGKVPELLDRTVLRWTGTHADMPFPQDGGFWQSTHV